MPIGTSDLDALEALTGAFEATVPHVDPRSPVPWCGAWQVEDLVVHLARVHHWAASQAVRRTESPLGRGPFDPASLYAECRAELLTTLRGLDPTAGAWTLADDGVPTAEQTGTVAFWHRRQKLETLVHLWDLRAAGALPVDLTRVPGAGVDGEAESALYADCVDEVVTVMHPRQVRLGRGGRPGVRLVLATDDRSWELAGARADAETVRVSGAARTLALLLWGRTTLADPGLALDGDAEAAAALLASPITP